MTRGEMAVSGYLCLTALAGVASIGVMIDKPYLTARARVLGVVVGIIGWPVVLVGYLVYSFVMAAVELYEGFRT